MFWTSVLYLWINYRWFFLYTEPSDGFSFPKSLKWHKSPLSSPALNFSNSSDLSPCFFLPRLLWCSHNSLLSVPLVLQVHSYPRALALALPAAYCKLPPRELHGSLISFSAAFWYPIRVTSPDQLIQHNSPPLWAPCFLALLYSLHGVITISYIFTCLFAVSRQGLRFVYCYIPSP